MRIVWYGHAAFAIESEGRRLILDPYSPECGFKPITDAADIVSISHENPKYHSGTGTIPTGFRLINGLSIADKPAVLDTPFSFRSLVVYENDRQEGPNAIVIIACNGLTICHMGDLGHDLTDDQLAQIGPVDILLALAGGPPTLPLPILRTVIDRMCPKVVIPMHYRTGGIDLRIQPIEDFLALCPAGTIQQLGRDSFEVSRASLPESTQIVVMRHRH